MTHLMDRARQYYVNERFTKYHRFRERLRTAYKLPLDNFGTEAMRRRDNHTAPSPSKKGPRIPAGSEPESRGSLFRHVAERNAFFRLACSPRLFRMFLRHKELVRHKLARMEISLKDLGLHQGWRRLEATLRAAIDRAVSEIREHRRNYGLGAEAYAAKSIARRRKLKGIQSDNPGSDERGKLVCADCHPHPETQAQQESRPWAPGWWNAMLRGVYRSRADIGTVERALQGDPETRLCVVHGIVMVVCCREGEKPHLLVLDMEPLGGHGFDVVIRPRARPKPKPKSNDGQKTAVNGTDVSKQTGRKPKAPSKGKPPSRGQDLSGRAQLRKQVKRLRDAIARNEHEPRKRRRRDSSPLSRG